MAGVYKIHRQTACAFEHFENLATLFPLPAGENMPRHEMQGMASEKPTVVHRSRKGMSTALAS